MYIMKQYGRKETSWQALEDTKEVEKVRSEPAVTEGGNGTGQERVERSHQLSKHIMEKGGRKMTKKTE